MLFKFLSTKKRLSATTATESQVSLLQSWNVNCTVVDIYIFQQQQKSSSPSPMKLNPLAKCAYLEK